MIFASVNWLAVLVCVLVSMVSGFVWYSPKTFFPVWWKGLGKGDVEPGMEGNMTLTWILTVLSSVFQAVFMSLAVGVSGPAFGGVSLISGLATGGALWLGLIAPAYLVNNLFGGYSLKVWAIEAGNHLLNLLLFGAILAVWR